MRCFLAAMCSFILMNFMSGCGWLIRAIEGTETLEDQPVTGLQLETVDGSREVCAGEPIQLRVRADVEGKEPLATWAFGPDGRPAKKGHLNFTDFSFTTDLGEVNAKNGTLVVPNTGLGLLGRKVAIHVSSKHAQGHTAQMELGLHFGCGVTLGYSGQPGQPGYPGSPGSTGRDGRSESSSGSYAAPGGHGEDGTDGADGGHGGPGGHGHNLLVEAVKIRAQNSELVLVQVSDQSNGNLTRNVIIDPAGSGRVIIYANGGAGGDGGSGGIGGSGGHGGTGAPPGDGGNGGNGGNGGTGGDGGNGGAVTLIYDANHADLPEYIEIHNQGGPGGRAGSAGPSGSGTSAYSGARAGRSGQPGRMGHDGRPGSDGQPVQPRAVHLDKMFPGKGDINFI